MSSEPTQILEDYLKKVKDKLPGWMKDKKAECQEVMDELSEHIWNKAEELAQGNPVLGYHMQGAVDSMEAPEILAREYKKRGTPKVFISEELFPLFKKTENIVLSVLFGINLIVFIVKLVTEPDWVLLWDFFTSLWASLVPIAVAVAGIFVGLSMEGFFPEDLKDIDKDDSHYHATIEMESIKSEIKAESKSEIDSELKKEKKKKKKKHPVQPGDLISSGIFNLIFAYIIFTQPWGLMANFLMPEYLIYMKAYAVIPLAEGIIGLVRGVIGKNNIFGQRLFMLGAIIVDILSITFLIQVKNTEVLRMFRFGAEAVWHTVPEWIMIVIIVFSIIGIMEKLGKIGKLRRKVNAYNQFHAKATRYR